MKGLPIRQKIAPDELTLALDELFDAVENQGVLCRNLSIFARTYRRDIMRISGTEDTMLAKMSAKLCVRRVCQSLSPEKQEKLISGLKDYRKTIASYWMYSTSG